VPRTLKDAKIESRAARARLPIGDHWRTIEPQRLHLGYRKRAKDQAGQWLVRRYLGNQRYNVAPPLGVADDLVDAGPGVLSYAEAQRLAHSYLWDSSHRRSGGIMTVADAIADYLAYLRAERATAHDTGTRARVWILPKLGARRIAELTKSDIETWLRWVASQPAKIRGGHQKAPPTEVESQRARKATANRTFTVLRAALNKAFNDGRVDDDRAWRRVKPFRNVNAARPGFLTVEECKRLINAADAASGFRDLVHAALATGARYGELCNVRVRDLVNDKLYIRTSKSGRPRNIVLTPEGAAFFARLAAGKPGTDFLLLRYGLPWRPSDQARPMRLACAAARIDRIPFHSLRHCYASLFVMAGGPLQTLAVNLGHASITQIERHYGHLRESYIDTSIREHAPTFGLVEESNVAPFSERRN
jgi:integrase